MYSVDSDFPRKAVISSFTQTMGFESGITVVQARSIVDDRSVTFNFEADDFIKNGYRSNLIARLKKQKNYLNNNITKLNERIIKLRKSISDVSTTDSATEQAKLLSSNGRLSFLREELKNLESISTNNNKIDKEVAKKESYISLLKKKPEIVEVSLSKRDNLKNLLRDNLVKDPDGMNIYIVSASISDRAHWFDVLRIGNVVNVADAAGDSLRYLTQTYVEDIRSSFRYNYNVKRLQYSSGCCETFAIELPFYWLRLWTFNDEFENIVFEGDSFPKIFSYFDEFAFGRVQPKKGQTQILVREGYMTSLKKDMDTIGDVVFSYDSRTRTKTTTFKDIFNPDFDQSKVLLRQLNLFPEKEENVDIPGFMKLGHILFQTQRNIEYYNRGFSRLVMKKLPNDTPIRQIMLEIIQKISPTASFCQNKSDDLLYKTYNEVELVYGLNGNRTTKNIANIVTDIKIQTNFGVLPHIVAWNEDFREDLLMHIYNKSDAVNLSGLFFEGQTYVEGIIKKYEIFEKLEQKTITDQDWVDYIFPKTINFVKIAEGSDKSFFVYKFAKKVLYVNLREKFFENLSKVNQEEQDIILDEVFYENQRLARVRLQKASLLKDIGITFDVTNKQDKIAEATIFIKKIECAIRNSTVTGIGTQETSDTEDLSSLEEELCDFIKKVEEVSFINLPATKSSAGDTWDSFEKTRKDIKGFFGLK